MHLKALYLKGFINGKSINKMMGDTRATINIMLYLLLYKLGRSAEDLIKTNIMLNDFNGHPSEAQGVLITELTVGQTIPTSFLIINSKSTYIILL